MESILPALEFGVPGIILAALLDVFFITGVVFNGVLLLTTASTLYIADKISGIDIFLSAYFGSYLASSLNYLTGRYGASLTIVEKVKLSRTGGRIVKMLSTRALFPLMVFSRFTTFLRPVYGLIIGAFGISPGKFFLLEAIVCAIWVGFWTFAIVGAINWISLEDVIM